MLKEQFNLSAWNSWPEKYKLYKAASLDGYLKEQKNEIFDWLIHLIPVPNNEGGINIIKANIKK